MITSLARLLLQKNLCTRLNAPRYGFVAFQQKKKADITKKCIQLLIQNLSWTCQTQLLKQYHQYGYSQAIKSYTLQNSNTTLGQLSNYLCESQMIVLEMQGGMEKFVNALTQCADMRQMQLQSIGLDYKDNLRNFLLVVEHIQQRTPIYFQKYIYSFLINYIQQFDQIKDQNLYQITKFLTNRGYLSKNMLRHFKNYDFDKKKGQQLLNESATEVNAYFQKLSLVLQTIINLQALQAPAQNNQSYDANNQVISAKTKSQIIQLFFQFLQNQQSLEYVLRVWDPQLIFINQLFSTHKQRYLQIIKKFTNPTTFSCIKMNPNLYGTVFTKMFLYCSFEDKAEVFEILNSFTKCLKNISNDSIDQKKIGAPGLILLCSKFDYNCPDLYYFITVYHATAGLHVSPFYMPVNLQKYWKNKVNFRNANIQRCNLILTIMNSIKGKKSLLEPTLLNILFKRIDKLRQVYKPDLFHIAEGILSQKEKDFEKTNQTKFLHSTQQFTYYLQYDIFYIRFDQKYLDYSKKVEDLHQVTINNQWMKVSCHPVSLRLFAGARLKALIQCIYNTKFFAKNNEKGEDMFRLIQNNKQFMESAQQNIAYPGLLQLIYSLYYSSKLTKNNQSGADSGTGSQLQKFVKANQSSINTIYKTRIKQFLQSKTQIAIKPQFCNGIQLLSNNQVKTLPNIYSDINNYRISNFKLLSHLKKYQKLRSKITQQLKILQKKPSFFVYPNYGQFPFFADYFLLYDRKEYVIIFVDQEQKQRYDNIIRRKKIEPLSKINSQQRQKNQMEQNTYGQIMSQKELSIRFFQSNHTVILISQEQDLSYVRALLQKPKSTGN